MAKLHTALTLQPLSPSLPAVVTCRAAEALRWVLLSSRPALALPWADRACGKGLQTESTPHTYAALLTLLARRPASYGEACVALWRDCSSGQQVGLRAPHFASAFG